MLMRAVGAVALTLSLSSGALAGNHPGAMERMSCSVVRYYVARYSASTAEMWARSHGATEAQIEAARRCLRDAPTETAQASRWYAQ
jgi:hypothetical protein